MASQMRIPFKYPSPQPPNLFLSCFSTEDAQEILDWTCYTKVDLATAFEAFMFLELHQGLKEKQEGQG